jgi:hypothetical protein
MPSGNPGWRHLFSPSALQEATARENGIAIEYFNSFFLRNSF